MLCYTRDVHSQRSVLIVDDDPEFLSALSLAFSEAGYIAVTETDGQSALTRFNEVSFDAVVVDLNLPDIGGFQLIVVIRKTRSSIPIIAITGKYASQYLEVAQYLGAQFAIPKPAVGESLVGVVNAVTNLCGATSLGAT